MAQDVDVIQFFAFDQVYEFESCIDREFLGFTGDEVPQAVLRTPASAGVGEVVEFFAC